MKILFASSEVWPLIKTGGLADVSYSLPHALKSLDVDISLVIPAYRQVLQQVVDMHVLTWLEMPEQQCVARILRAQHPAFDFPLFLVDVPHLFDRAGNPYVDENGHDWADNAKRFSVFSHAVSLLAQHQKPDVVHCNDWQTGLAPAYLNDMPHKPKCVFTIHNLAYAGHYSHAEFLNLKLPWYWWHLDGVEFYGGLSMLKSGIVYADEITTVSPTYAEEICTPAFSYGMDGIIAARHYKLSGILNGIDQNLWNPQTDPHLAAHYSAKRRNPGKHKNKQALLEIMGANISHTLLKAPLLGSVGRLVEQKGIDLLLDVIPDLLENTHANFVFIGSGDLHLEHRLRELTEQHPSRIFTYIGYSEHRAHLLEAGCDMFLMPSRFEPCGLNQLYSLCYGTVPIVNKTGGLADTVVDTNDESLKNQTATGFVMQAATHGELLRCVYRALDCFSQARQWQQLQRTGMAQDFSWEHSAKTYITLYEHDTALLPLLP
jgi:starch synthase